MKRHKETRPLRRIIGHIELPLTDIPHATIAWFEVYECGHVRTQKQDMIGPTNAERRRCHRCALGKPPDIALDDSRIGRLEV